MHESTSAGRYGDSDLVVLSKSLLWTKSNLGLTVVELSKKLIFSPKVISSILGCNRPRFDNFLRCTNNLIALLDEWISEHPGVPPVFSGQPADWRTLKASASKKIQKIAQEITELLDIVRYSNSLAMSDGILTPELRAQLVALLETTLAQLHSPVIEKSFMSKMASWIPKLGKKVAAEAGEKVVEKLARDAGAGLIDLLEHLT